MYNARLDGLTEYPFQRLAALLAGLNPPSSDKGADQTIMSIGEPQHTPPALLHAALAKAQGDWGKYPPNAGTPAYRTAVAAWCTQRFNLPAGYIDSEKHILPLAGSREGLFMAAQLCVPATKNGRTSAVLMPNPFYQVYFGAAVMNGAEPVFVAATRETDFQPNYEAVAREDLERTAMAYLCTPSNPQGTIATLAQLKTAITLARKHDFVLACDECYSEIYDDAPPAGALQACAELGEGLNNVLVFNSLSKRSSVPGLRAGFVAGDPDLIAKLSKLRAHGGAVQPLPVMAAATALWSDETHVIENRALYRAKNDDAERIFGNRFGFYRPAGGFFLWLDVKDGEAAARALWEKGGIKVLPGAYLARATGGTNPGQAYIRVALVHERAKVADALARMIPILETV
ncbi:MAG: aminotransferase class I/II-fold pyridoxal phosphate-dependent enzyme [Proteobacteria bacterium]|nr:aminotransferase class I/II-fold pyridoxal phosphate-dependent enzyme [Pseudomonadota bacterium]